jgi:hypothetical protein
LATDSGPTNLNVIPDYLGETSEIYKRMAISMLRMTRNLDILSVPRTSTISNVGILPSWVPDWSVSDDTVPLRGMFSRVSTAFINFAATPANALASIHFSDDNNVLGILGHTVDTIVEIGQVYNQSLEGEVSWLQRLERFPYEQAVLNNWEKISRCRSGIQYVTGEAILDAYWKTIGFGNPDRAKEDFLEWDQSHRSVARRLPLEGLRPLFPIIALPMVVSQGISMFRHDFDMDKVMGFRYALTTSQNRRLFRTQGGYIGLAPALAMSGDRIALFKGGMVPLIIREEGTRWRLIGDCYIHGMMKGEAFQEDECSMMWFV